MQKKLISLLVLMIFIVLSTSRVMVISYPAVWPIKKSPQRSLRALRKNSELSLNSVVKITSRSNPTYPLTYDRLTYKNIDLLLSQSLTLFWSVP